MAIETFQRQHTVWVMDRGGKQRIYQLLDVSSVEWNRVRDDISTATIKISAEKAAPQGEFIATLAGAVGRYEICIWRGENRVWEGPITLVTSKREGVEIMARDVMHYTNRLWMSQAYDNSFNGAGVTFATTRVKGILDFELARKDTAELGVGLPSVNVLPYIVEHHEASDAETTRNTPAYAAYVFEHLDDIAAKGGMDYTVVGRAIHLWDTSKPAMGYTKTVTESDFLGEVYVSIYGMELGTVAGVTDGQGNIGVAGAVDPYYGLVERLETAYDEDQTAAPSQSELHSQAQRNLAGRNPTPLQLRVPDGSSINMEGVLEIEDLVPGIYMPMLATINLITVSQMQKLHTVRVTESAEGEDVQVTLFPASSADEEEGS